MSMRLFAAVLVLAVVTCAGVPALPPDEAPPNVPVVRPIVRAVTEFADFTGRTDAATSVDIRARVTGFIEKVAFKEGSMVKQGDLLFEIDSRPYRAELERAEAVLAQAEARLRRAEAEVARAKALLGQKAISKEDFDKAVADRVEAEGMIAAAKAAAAVARLNLDYTKVMSPISGQIGRAYMTAGNLVKADDTLLTTVVSMKPAFVYFEVDENTVLRQRQAALVGKGKEPRAAEIEVLVGLANEKGYPHKGKLDFVNNRVDPQKGTLTVRAVLPNEDGLLMPGLFTRVRLPLGEPTPALLVPDSAVVVQDAVPYLYVVNDKDTVQKTRVTLGSRHDNLIVIKTGLTEKDRVAVGRLKDLRDGTVVLPVKGDVPPAP
jgi:RND family efflux transporter MFP subunit